MRKTIIKYLALTVISSVFLSVSASAQTIADLQVLVRRLQARLEALQQTSMLSSSTYSRLFTVPEMGTGDPRSPGANFNVNPSIVNSGGQATFSWSLPNTGWTRSLDFNCPPGVEARGTQFGYDYCGGRIIIDASSNSQVMTFLNHNLIPASVSVALDSFGALPCPETLTLTVNSWAAANQPGLHVITPNGSVGEPTLRVNSQILIRWASANVRQPNVRLTLIDSRSGAGELIGIVPNSGSYQWTVPSRLGNFDFAANFESWPEAIYQLSVATERRTAGDSAFDLSDTPFGVWPPPATIRVLVPNGGEAWYAGSTQRISWEAVSVGRQIEYLLLEDVNPSSPYYRRQYVLNTAALQYSDDGGSGWLEWTIPSTTPSSRYKIWVGSFERSVEDVSDSSFTITKPSRRY